jgi:pimeloyl-ACP methyl ester carboxylesterase
MLATLILPDGTPCALNYNSWGDASATRTLFCVHGLTRNGMDFEKLAQSAVTQGFRVIAPDMPGRGKSPRLANPAFYNNVVNANLCLQLLASLKVTQVDWVGTSMGGMIALLVANQMPGLMRRLVLNDIGCVITASSLKRIGEYVGNNPALATFAEAEASLKLRTAPFGIPENEWAHFAEHSIEQTPEGFRLAYDPAIAQGFSAIEPMADIQLWPLWKAVKRIPTLLIRGEDSDLLTADVAQKMQATHPHLTRYNVSNAGHAPALLTEQEINTVIGFLCQPQPAPETASLHARFSMQNPAAKLKKFWSLVRQHLS